MSQPTLFVFSRDPGATNVLIAVYEALSDADILRRCAAGIQRFAAEVAQGVEPRFVICAKGQAVEMWRAVNSEVHDWKEIMPPHLEDKDVLDLLADHKASAVLTGTSDVDERIDCELWRAARKLGLRSHVFLDHCSYFERRFADAGGKKFFPDRLYVPDNSYRKPVLAVGATPESITVVGDLHLDRTRRMAQRINRSEIEDLRAVWGAGPDTQVILFASECASEMKDMGRPSPYCEFEILEMIISNIRQTHSIVGIPVRPECSLVVIRPHPRDVAGKYDAYAAPDSPGVIVSNAGRSTLAILAADLILGMDSTMLFEAEALGRTAVSLVDSSTFGQRNKTIKGGNLSA